MREIEVVLDFACSVCGHDVSARLRCAGKGLAAGPHTVAAVRVCCPTCEHTNRLYFEPCGVVRAVEPFRDLHDLLEPLYN